MLAQLEVIFIIIIFTGRFAGLFLMATPSAWIKLGTIRQDPKPRDRSRASVRGLVESGWGVI